MRRHASFCSVHTDSVVLNITFWLSTRMQKVMCRDGSKISATISQDVSLTSVGGQIGQKKLIASCSFLFAVFKLEEWEWSLVLVCFPTALMVTYIQIWVLYLITLSIFILPFMYVAWHSHHLTTRCALGGRESYLTMYSYAFSSHLSFHSLGLQALATQVRWELSHTTSSYSLPWTHCLPSLWCSRQLPTTSTVYSQAEIPAKKQSTDTTGCYFCFLGWLLLLSQS